MHQPNRWDGGKHEYLSFSQATSSWWYNPGLRTWVIKQSLTSFTSKLLKFTCIFPFYFPKVAVSSFLWGQQLPPLSYHSWCSPRSLGVRAPASALLKPLSSWLGHSRRARSTALDFPNWGIPPCLCHISWPDHSPRLPGDSEPYKTLNQRTSSLTWLDILVQSNSRLLSKDMRCSPPFF